MLRILLNGAKGRMGQAIALAAALPDSGVTVVAALDQGDDAAAAIAQCDVAVDFSAPAGTVALAALCATHGKGLVIGTTGHSAGQREAILAQVGRCPIVWAGNYSVGVNVLLHLAERAAALLPGSFDIEIIEAHHNRKADAPSGTALNLLEAVKAGRSGTAHQIVYGREGQVGARPAGEIGLHAVRGGDIVGEHTVLFAGQAERVELVHRATDRKIFAHGALHAARWVAGQRPGLYDMRDVLGLK